MKTANQIRKREHSNSASGPDYFGFSNATVAKMIQDLPNVDKCTSYIIQRFEEPNVGANKDLDLANVKSYMDSEMLGKDV